MILSRVQGCCGVAELHHLTENSRGRGRNSFYDGQGARYDSLTVEILQRVHKDAFEKYNRSLLLATVINVRDDPIGRQTRKTLRRGGWKKYIHFRNVQTDRVVEVWGVKL